jgi:hypothetical protein
MSDPVFDTDISGVTVTLTGSGVTVTLPDLPTVSDILIDSPTVSDVLATLPIDTPTVSDVSGSMMADVSDATWIRFMCACFRRFFLTRPLSSTPPVMRD